MPILPAKNVTLVCDQNSPGQAQADRFRIPETENYIEVAVMLHTLFAGGSGTATPGLSVRVLGSQDGVNWATEIGPTTFSLLGTSAVSGQMTSAYLSFFWSLSLTGGLPADWGVVTFDVHANLKRV